MDLRTTHDSTAFGYPRAPYRIEWRPTYALPTREAMKAELDALEEAGVKAWWYSAAAKGSYPLFRSEHLPYRDDADDAFFQWLTEESHRRGMAILSWEHLNTAPMLAAQKPEWRYRWFGMEDGDPDDPRSTQFVCYNSPYGDLLMDYCVEVVDKLGFDGLWFDGSTLFGVGTAKRLTACCCEFCRKKYRDETGKELPREADLSDPAFRRYLNWRGDDFMDYWRRLADHVEARAPGKLIAMNHFNRLTQGWSSGTPLRRSPMRAMVSTEVGACFNHLRLHHKYIRAINDNLPTEVWTYLRDAANQRPIHRPEPDPANAIYLCQTAAACGGYMSFGLGADPTETRDCMRAISQALEPIQHHVGGEPEPCIGLVLSGATKDLFYDDPYEGWKQVHGAHNLFEDLHWPVEILLDNTLDRETLGRFQAVVLPDVRCLGDEATEALRAYVEAGGTVLAIGEAGTHDLDGDLRAEPALDDLFGIRRAGTADSGPQSAAPDDLFGSAARKKTVLNNSILHPQSERLRGGGLPARYMIAGNCLPVEASPEAEVLATTTYNTAPPGKRFGPQGLIPPEGEDIEVPVILARDHGAGRAITLRCQTSLGYAEQPHCRSREVVRRLLADRVHTTVTTDAPAGVVVAPWRQGERLAVHLLHVPSALRRFNNDTVDLGDIYWPEEPPPLDGFTLIVDGDWTKTFSLANGPLDTERTESGLKVTLPRLRAYDVVVLE